MTKEETKVEKTKEVYEKLSKKHNLPEFDILNKEFYIEEIELDNTYIPIKKIKRKVMEKIVNNARFLEMLLNPSHAPIFILQLIKKIDEKNKKIIQELYKEITEYEMKSFLLEIYNNEEEEIKFLKEIIKSNSLINQKLKEVLDDFNIIKEDLNNSASKNYFG